MISTKQSLSDLAITLPGASRVFLRHGLDFCCGGARSLQDASTAAGLDAGELIEELEAQSGAEADFVRWDEMPQAQLIEHLLEVYHKGHREELPPLLHMAKKVEAVHADKPTCPKGLYAHLTMVAQSLEDHMLKEEEILFPNILAGNGPQMGMPIQVMESEHVDHGRNLEKIRRLTNDLTPPEEACTTWRALYLGLDEFVGRVLQHVHLENNVLFRRALEN